MIPLATSRLCWTSLRACVLGSVEKLASALCHNVNQHNASELPVCVHESSASRILPLSLLPVDRSTDEGSLDAFAAETRIGSARFSVRLLLDAEETSWKSHRYIPQIMSYSESRDISRDISRKYFARSLVRSRAHRRTSRNPGFPRREGDINSHARTHTSNNDTDGTMTRSIVIVQNGPRVTVKGYFRFRRHRRRDVG